MKTLLAFLTAFALVATVERPAQAAHQTISIDVFYDALAPYGDWVEVEGYGYCFRPTVSLEDPEWKPYTEGSWIYTDAGWTWDSEEDFGWATFHYGRWFLLSGTWFWLPGDTWGPAWVSWRTSDEYVGWAPLPPEAHWESDTGFGIYVDLDFNIGPACYSFLPVQYLGHHHVRRWIEPWRRNVEFMRITDNRTRITHRTTENHLTAVFNDGPDFTVLSRRTEQPIRRLTLSEQESVEWRDRSARRKNMVQNDRFQVIAPDVERGAERKAAPDKVAHRFDRSRVNRGWEGFREDEVRELRAKMATASRTPNRDRDASREGKVAERIPKAVPAEPQASPPEDRPGKSRDTTPSTAQRTPTKPPTDPKATPPRDKNDRSSVNAEIDPLRKVEPPRPGRDSDERTRIRPGEATEDIRKAVPVVPQREGDPASKSKGKGKAPAAPTGDDLQRTPQRPGSDLRPGIPDRFRNEPEITPPRPPTPPRSGIDRPEDLPPMPPRTVVPDGSNTQRIRPGSTNMPKVDRDRGRQENRTTPQAAPPRIPPSVAPLVPPEAKPVEPRRTTPPSPQPPRTSPDMDKPRPTPPPSARPPTPLPEPSAKRPEGKKTEDDGEKKRPR